MIHMQKQIGRIQISIDAYFMGKEDVVVLISGGDVPHLGTITASSSKEPLQTIQFQQHQEFYITEEMAVRLRKHWSGNFAICGGIHMDQISTQEITALIELSIDMGEELIRKLQEMQKEKI